MSFIIIDVSNRTRETSMSDLPSTDFPHLVDFIRSLGPNDEERGKKIGVSGRTIRRWIKEQRWPDGWPLLKRTPILAEPFCKDITPPTDEAA
jgi:hypothetical protein